MQYTGEIIRPPLADVREKRYEETGVQSTYLFKIDMSTVIDATVKGSRARYINHSCNVSAKADK